MCALLIRFQSDYLSRLTKDDFFCPTTDDFAHTPAFFRPSANDSIWRQPDVPNEKARS